ncbi:hypothetical protein ACX3VT_04000 [Aerococcus sanguinicola]|uniref:hypothetical protein n=1 Tax=unclassified Aerococcus TaxID=2618060 RepID=UPI0008A40474|nr:MULTISPECIES: hypothetical protein [unclassified Aerococcus]KAB0645765.1 hypothetical protein F6I01_09895 [Aerococcus sanguinicola]MDK6234322.1 hypothetical protein [Aerococcus sp. UMB10185]MDK6805636.1 hypothetical protein [Aerococcus sp. UMB7834]MDK6856426.1 hypothetical protein [Aerococcus sp. UMB7533]MDK8502781.1 hypothetical protein [Aerococcus sp. UMB1112A]
MDRVHQFLYRTPELIKLLIIAGLLISNYILLVEHFSAPSHRMLLSLSFFILAVVLGMVFRRPKTKE